MMKQLAFLIASLIPSLGNAQPSWDRVIASDKFNKIWSAFEHNGVLYVEDYAPEVMRFSVVTGEQLPSLGRKGEGPGEFTGLASIGVRGDTIWAFNEGRRRISLFVDGKYVGLISTRTIAERVEAVLPNALLTREREDWPTIFAERKNVFRHVLRGLDLQDRKVAFSREVPKSEVIRLDPQNRGGGYTGPSPLATSDIVRVAHNGAAAYSINRGNYKVTRVDLTTGDIIWSRVMPFEPLSMTSERRQHFADQLAETILSVPLMRRQYASDAALRTDVQREINEKAARIVPPVTDAVVGTDGTLWVRREFLGNTNISWDVVSTDGRKLQSITLPTGFQGMSAGPGFIWGVEKDELDVPKLIRYPLKQR